MKKKKPALEEILSPLPGDLASIVHRVVRRTRLWPGEKIDVARELVGHFLDGLETLQQDKGLAVDAAAKELVESFGNEKLAARLICRSKKRCRPVIWELGIRLCQGVGICVLP